jgi:hypothetical protein
MSPSDRIVQVEMVEIEHFVALGFDRYEAIRAVEAGIDWRTVEPVGRPAETLPTSEPSVA